MNTDYGGSVFTALLFCEVGDEDWTCEFWQRECVEIRMDDAAVGADGVPAAKQQRCDPRTMGIRGSRL